MIPTVPRTFFGYARKSHPGTRRRGEKLKCAHMSDLDNINQMHPSFRIIHKWLYFKFQKHIVWNMLERISYNRCHCMRKFSICSNNECCQLLQCPNCTKFRELKCLRCKKIYCNFCWIDISNLICVNCKNKCMHCENNGTYQHLSPYYYHYCLYMACNTCYIANRKYIRRFGEEVTIWEKCAGCSLQKIQLSNEEYNKNPALYIIQ